LLWLDAFWSAKAPAGVGYTMLALWKFVDNHKLTAFPTRETLASMTGHTVRSVDRHITEAEKCGWVERVAPGHRGRSTQYRLRIGSPWGAAGTSSTSDSTSCMSVHGDRMQSPVTEGATPVSVKADTGVAPTTYVTTQETTHLDTPSAEPRTLDNRRKDYVEADTDEPTTIPLNWHVNGIHVQEAKASNLHARSIGDVFRKWATATGERSTNWDRKFGALLLALSVDVNPECEGFANARGALYEYSTSGEWDWWSYPPYFVGEREAMDWTPQRSYAGL
jgi:hypothetical protein